MFEIRRIESDDGSVLRSLRLAALQDEPAAFGSTYVEEVAYPEDLWIDRASARAAGEPGTNFFAIPSDGSPVGIVGVFCSDYGTATAEITSMWIAPQARGHALGARLVEAAIAWATAAGYSAMELWVTRGNIAAERLYAKLGFVATDEVQPLPSDPCRSEVRMYWSGRPTKRPVDRLTGG